CARESPRRTRKRRNLWPASCGASTGLLTRPCFLRTWTMAGGLRPRARRRKMARCNRRTSDSVYMRYRLLVRCGAISPSASQERNAEEEIFKWRATSEMRRRPSTPEESDGLEKFFLFDTALRFL